MLKQIYSFIGFMLIATQTMSMNAEHEPAVSQHKQQNPERQKMAGLIEENSKRMLLLDQYMTNMVGGQKDVHNIIGQKLHELGPKRFMCPSVKELDAHLEEVSKGNWEFRKDGINLQMISPSHIYRKNTSSWQQPEMSIMTDEQYPNGKIKEFQCLYKIPLNDLDLIEKDYGVSKSESTPHDFNLTAKFIASEETRDKYDMFIDREETSKDPNLERLYGEMNTTVAEDSTQTFTIKIGGTLYLPPEGNVMISFYPKKEHVMNRKPH